MGSRKGSYKTSSIKSPRHSRERTGRCMGYLQLIEILIPVVREVDKINPGVRVCLELAMHERATCKENDIDFIIPR